MTEERNENVGEETTEETGGEELNSSQPVPTMEEPSVELILRRLVREIKPELLDLEEFSNINIRETFTVFIKKLGVETPIINKEIVPKFCITEPSDPYSSLASSTTEKEEEEAISPLVSHGKDPKDILPHYWENPESVYTVRDYLRDEVLLIKVLKNLGEEGNLSELKLLRPGKDSITNEVTKNTIAEYLVSMQDKLLKGFSKLSNAAQTALFIYFSMEIDDHTHKWVRRSPLLTEEKED